MFAGFMSIGSAANTVTPNPGATSSDLTVASGANCARAAPAHEPIDAPTAAANTRRVQTDPSAVRSFMGGESSAGPIEHPTTLTHTTRQPIGCNPVAWATSP